MIAITLNEDFAKRVILVKQDTGKFTVKRGFKKWLNYIKKETYKTYIDNLHK
jgi:hypothetical protein